MKNQFEITAEYAFDENGNDAILVKMYSEVTELNIYIPRVELDRFNKFLDQKTNYCSAGKCANTNAHWKYDDDDLYIMIGDDVDVWDFCITSNKELLNKIKIEISNID